MSPELILAMREHKTEIDTKVIYKSDIFALGMCVLETASLKKSKDCYD